LPPPPSAMAACLLDRACCCFCKVTSWDWLGCAAADALPWRMHGVAVSRIGRQQRRRRRQAAAARRQCCGPACMSMGTGACCLPTVYLVRLFGLRLGKTPRAADAMLARGAPNLCPICFSARLYNMEMRSLRFAAVGGPASFRSANAALKEQGAASVGIDALWQFARVATADRWQSAVHKFDDFRSVALLPRAWRCTGDPRQ